MAKKTNQVDTSMLAFDINKSTFVKDIEKAFTSFKEYECPKYLRKSIFSWIVLMYDVNSPIRLETSDYYEQKAICAKIVGFNTNSDNEYSKNIESILLGKDQETNNLIVDYIISFSSPEYTQLKMFIIMQRHIMKSLLRGSFNPKTSDMITSTSEKIESLTRLVYHSGDRIEIEEARRALYKKAGEDINKLKPEAIAEMLDNNGELPAEWSIYGDDYTPDDLKFEGDDLSILEEDGI